MNLLLDTHSLIWFLNGDARLSEIARTTIEDTGNSSFVSTVSVWEMTIKCSLGKLKLKGTLEDTRDQFIANGFDLLPISFEHAITLQNLEFYHRDPFDRMIIAQALTENLSIITKDITFNKYTVPIIW